MLGLEWSSGRKAVRDRRLQALCSFVQVLEDLIQDIHGGTSHFLIGSSSFTKKLPGLAAEYLSVTGPPLSCEPQACNQRKQRTVAILAGGISLERLRHDGNRDGTGRRGRHS